MLKYILGLIFPERCIFCGIPTKLHSSNPYICEKCSKKMPYADTGSDTAVPGVAVFRYSAVRDTIFLFKYRGYKKYGRLLGELMAEYVINNDVDFILNADVIVPVPLWRTKEKKRGFNQAALLAEAVANKLGTDFDSSMLLRTRDTKSQNKLGRHERLENIRGAFALNKGHHAENKSVVIVDDIYTTGITIYECARALFSGGAREVYFLALSSPQSADSETAYNGGDFVKII